MVCEATETTKLSETAVAGAKLVLPAWVAVMPQVPSVRRVTVLPEAEHAEGVVEAKLTGKPDDAVAFKLTGVALKVWLGIGAKVMVCASPLTVKLCWTCGAAA